MITRMTAAWGANVTNLLAFLSVFIAALCIFAVGVGFFTDRTFLDSFGLAFTLATDVYIVWVAAFWLYNRRVSGAVLLDCGPHKGKAIFLLFATFLFFRELLSVISASGAFSVETVQELLFAAFFLYLALGRLQIRENGIWEHGSLLRWHRIISYRWTDHGTLMLHTKGRLLLLPGDLLVPLEHEEAVTALLIERAPQARES